MSDFFGTDKTQTLNEKFTSTRVLFYMTYLLTLNSKTEIDFVCKTTRWNHLLILVLYYYADISEYKTQIIRALCMKKEKVTQSNFFFKSLFL